MFNIKAVLFHPHLHAAVILGVALTVFYRDVVFNGHTFLIESFASGTMAAGPYGYPGDPGKPANWRVPAVDRGAIAWVHMPSLVRIPQVLAGGELPLWDPHSGLGQPHFAGGQTGTFEPLQFVCYFIPRSLWTYTFDAQLLLRFFLAGFFAYLFLTEMGLSFIPAVFGGMGFMLSSYLVDFGYHPQCRVDTLMPLVLYAYERLLRRPGPASVLICIGAITWAILADFPEATFITLQFGTLWYIFRALGLYMDSRFSGSSLRTNVVNLSMVLLMAFALCAVTLLPLLENIHFSEHAHAKGTGAIAEPDWTAVLSLVPYYYVPSIVWVPHYYIVVFTLAIFAVFAVRGIPAYSRTAWFFAVYFFFGYSKSYGAPWAAWIGKLPVYDQLNFPKYISPSLDLSLLVLAAIGLQYLRDKGPSYRLLMPAIFVIAAAIAAYLWLFGMPPADAAALGWQLRKVILIIAACSAVFYIGETFKLKPRMLTLAFIPLLFIEAVGWHRTLRRELRYDPYVAPPFVKFLQEDKQPYRVFSADGFLYPSTSMVFGIDDSRYLVALDSKRRSAFYKALITPGYHGVRVAGDEYPIYYWSKFFDLLNIKYIIAAPGKTTPESILHPILHLADQPEIQACFNKPAENIEFRAVSLGNEEHPALCMHPGSKTDCPLHVPPGRSSLHFSIGLDEKGNKGGEKENLRLSLTDKAGEHEIFQGWVDSTISANPGISNAHGWVPTSIDLSQWSGQQVSLTFSAEALPAAKGSADWACWSSPDIAIDVAHPQLGNTTTEKSRFDLVYDKEVRIFKNESAYPRAIVVHQVELAKDIDDALVHLSRADFDPHTTAVLEGDLHADWNRDILVRGTSQFTPAEVIEYRTNSMTVKTTLDKAGVLVVSDSYFPGWSACVDGKPAPVLAVDAALRGVYLEKGAHEVLFVYFPSSFKLGAGISLSALMLIMVWAVWLGPILSRRNRKIVIPAPRVRKD